MVVTVFAAVSCSAHAGMQQGYLMPSGDYTTVTPTASMIFQTVMGPITIVPEPSSFILAGFGILSFLLFIKRKA